MRRRRAAAATELFPRQNGASVGFTVSYPLFSGGQTYFNVRAARASLLSALASLRSGTNDADLTLAQNFKALVDAVENRRIQEELLECQPRCATRLRGSRAVPQRSDFDFQDFSDITDASTSPSGKQRSQAQQTAVNAEANWEQSPEPNGEPYHEEEKPCTFNWRYLIVAVIVILPAAWAIWLFLRWQAAQPVYDYLKVDRGEMRVTLRESGVIQPEHRLGRHDRRFPAASIRSRYPTAPR